ncbi:MAG: hypothetical protein KC586_06880 [Myxococcales bacterium]|nr:hypothetical protein [Myxococcales bacterium]
MTLPTVAYVSGIRLFVRRPGAEPVEVRSKFAEDVRARATRLQKKHAWKQGRGSQFQGALLWGMDPDGGDDGSALPAAVVSVGAGRKPGEILYSLAAGSVTAVLAADATADAPGDTEQRLFHTSDFDVRWFHRVDTHEWIASTTSGVGVSNLAVMHEDGSDFTVLTEGDSVDAAPRWILGAHSQLVFQSAGVGRDDQGFPVGLGPFEIQRLDVPSSEMETVLAREGRDLLEPRLDAKGTLHFVERPWKEPRAHLAPTSVGRAFLDFLLFPLRLIFALFSYLNFFTARYTGKPLTTAGGPKQRAADARQMMIWGNLIDASQASGREGDDGPSAVPKSWRLIRRVDERDEILARGVVTYDLTPDGGLVYSTGRELVYVAPSGERTKLAEGEHLTQVVVVP